MKKIIILLLVILSVTGLHAQFGKANLQAAGLTCAMCNNAVNKALQQLDFIEKVTPDIKSASFEIVFRKGVTVNIDAIRSSVEDAGFSIAKLKLTGIFSDVKVEKDQHVKYANTWFHFLNGNGIAINGEQTITIVDRNFLPEKQFKKFSAASSMKCVQSGHAADCCSKEGLQENERIYHVII